ncbi:BgTH12-02521 [Blumeria graminis f. sp. triticale]|uniref:BgTH12-02521 n=1 Tax=Blumeria graminis f. sp. triticale TaxID=1689686 RepID=A0A9W4GF12_BLUGR|nr:BgTH12-02521 [Blumeria graminis f. sp. triticale]
MLFKCRACARHE